MNNRKVIDPRKPLNTDELSDIQKLLAQADTNNQIKITKSYKDNSGQPLPIMSKKTIMNTEIKEKSGTLIEADKSIIHLTNCSLIKFGERYYVIEELLGKGGFGKVKKLPKYYFEKDLEGKYQQKTIVSDDIPVVKVIQKDPTRLQTWESYKEDIEREYEGLKIACGDKNAELFLDEKRQKAYLKMSFVPGKTLDSYLIEHKNIPLKKRMQILSGLIEILQKVHKKGYCNLDLKPENIMYDERTGKISVIDWGSVIKQDTKALNYIPATPIFKGSMLDSALLNEANAVIGVAGLILTVYSKDHTSTLDSLILKNKVKRGIAPESMSYDFDELLKVPCIAENDEVQKRYFTFIVDILKSLDRNSEEYKSQHDKSDNLNKQKFYLIKLNELNNFIHSAIENPEFTSQSHQDEPSSIFIEKELSAEEKKIYSFASKTQLISQEENGFEKLTDLGKLINTFFDDVSKDILSSLDASIKSKYIKNIFDVFDVTSKVKRMSSNLTHIYLNISDNDIKIKIYSNLAKEFINYKNKLIEFLDEIKKDSTFSEKNIIVNNLQHYISEIDYLLENHKRLYKPIQPENTLNEAKSLEAEKYSTTVTVKQEQIIERNTSNESVPIVIAKKEQIIEAIKPKEDEFNIIKDKLLSYKDSLKARNELIEYFHVLDLEKCYDVFKKLTKDKDLISKFAINEDTAFGPKKSKEWQNTLKEIRKLTKIKLNEKIEAESDNRDKIRLLKQAKQEPIFTEHRSNFWFTGKWGKTKTAKEITQELDSIKKLKK